MWPCVVFAKTVDVFFRSIITHQSPKLMSMNIYKLTIVLSTIESLNVY